MKILTIAAKILATVAAFPIVVLCGAFGDPATPLIDGLREMWGTDQPKPPPDDEFDEHW